MSIVRNLVYTGLLFAVLGVGFFLYLGQSSQDGSAPGLVNGRLAPCPESPNCVSSETGTAAEKTVEALSVDSWESLPDAVTNMGGIVTSANERYMSAEFTSALMGFVDDVEFRKGDGVIHLRSASRVGYSDAGVNAGRITALRSELADQP